MTLLDLNSDLDRAMAYRKGMSMDQLLEDRARVQALRDAAPDVEYVNGVMRQDGQRATSGQVEAYNKTNPYIVENWLATPEDRELTARQQAEKEGYEEENRTRHMAEQAARLATQVDFFGRPLGPVVRSNELPPKGIKVEQVSVEAIPSKPITYNSAAGAKPPLASILGGLVSRTAKPRTTS